jgi:aerobic-type carbon monoxide dehydrogenase small subunit (CoxS/CutS family)
VRFDRRDETARAVVDFVLDGEPAQGLAGDTLMTAILTRDGYVCRNEFDGTKRAGFCLMGACQDCVVSVEGRGRLNACLTYLEPGMRVVRP